jgi:hypothetical protein
VNFLWKTPSPDRALERLRAFLENEAYFLMRKATECKFSLSGVLKSEALGSVRGGKLFLGTATRTWY